MGFVDSILQTTVLLELQNNSHHSELLCLLPMSMSMQHMSRGLPHRSGSLPSKQHDLVCASTSTRLVMASNMSLGAIKENGKTKVFKVTLFI